MKISEVRIIQKSLVETGFYTGDIDGKRGSKTNAAIDKALTRQSAKLPENWGSWSNKRKAIAYLQILCHENGIDSGLVDGFKGPQTESAVEQLRVLLATGSLPRGFGDIMPIRANPLDFPQESFDTLSEYYGKPCEIQLVKVQCPWKLRLDWDLRSTTNTITIHEKLSDSLASILHEIYELYGMNGIAQLGLDRYGGSMNCRKKRGSVSAWSTHAWGISIDWFPSSNKLRWDSQRASLAHPDLDAWWEVWEKRGWISLGRTEDRDWMHVQAARRGG